MIATILATLSAVCAVISIGNWHHAVYHQEAKAYAALAVLLAIIASVVAAC